MGLKKIDLGPENYRDKASGPEPVFTATGLFRLMILLGFVMYSLIAQAIIGGPMDQFGRWLASLLR